MAQNLYVLLVVVCRTAGVWLVGRALFGLLFAAMLARGFGGLNVVMMGAIPSALGGVLLWLLAKPLARLVTHGL